MNMLNKNTFEEECRHLVILKCFEHGKQQGMDVHAIEKVIMRMDANGEIEQLTKNLVEKLAKKRMN